MGRDLPPSLLVGDWGSTGPDVRWAGKNVGLKLAGPASATARLEIYGYCPPSIPSAPKKQQLSVFVDGEPVGRAVLNECSEYCSFTFELPARLAHKPEILVELNIDPVFWSPEEEAFLGLPVKRFRIDE